ncbi:hypothetical protein [Pseudomonas sp. SDO5271_S396]
MSTSTSMRTDVTPHFAQLNETSQTSTSRPLAALGDKELAIKVMEMGSALDPWGNNFFTIHTAYQ